jgi:D-threo-aldose 1-dehydrogenase
MTFDPAAPRRIGRRDLYVSQLGVGTAPFGSAADGDDAVRGAFDALYGAGLRYFDTAPFYGTGLAERRLGACMRHVERSSLVISTKVGRLLKPVGGPASGPKAFEVQYDYSYDGTMRSIEHTLQRLGTNALDIVLVHDVNRRWQGDLVEQRYEEAMAGAHKALSELRDAGAIKAFGVGVNDCSILLRFAADGDFDCFMLAGRYTLLDHTALATFFYVEADSEIKERTRRIEAVCARHGVPLPAAALQFPLHHPAVASVVTGMRSAEEADANLAYCRTPIPAAFWDELKALGLIDRAAPTG